MANSNPSRCALLLEQRLSPTLRPELQDTSEVAVAGEASSATATAAEQHQRFLQYLQEVSDKVSSIASHTKHPDGKYSCCSTNRFNTAPPCECQPLADRL
jgi:hypothetical protein